MSANTPPKPHTEGMEFTNDETGIKYQFSGGAWRAVSSSASEEVAEAIDNLDLQKVLDKGNVADKGAEFGGKVTVDPGTQDNEVVTYGQLATVAEELEQLAPSFERGIYSISTQEVTSSSTHNGKYNLIRKNTSSDGNAARAACADAQNLCNRIPDNDPIDCQIEYNRCIDAIPGPGTVDIYISDFSQVEQLKFSKVDVNGENHTWDGVLIGQLIDVFNEDNDNYMVGRITAIEGTTVKTFSVDVLSSKGSASGNARIKVFSLSETGDVTNYVRKTGDTMTGSLLMTGYTSDATPLLKLAPETSLSNSSDVFAIRTLDNKKLLNVALNGNVSVNSDWVPSKTNSLTTKQYVDTSTAEICLGRKFIPTTSWPDLGNNGTTDHLYWDNSLIAWHPRDASGLTVKITTTELGDGANPEFEKGNVTLWGYQASTDQWRMIGCAVHDGEVHVKNDVEHTYYYVNLSWKYKPTVRASDWTFVRAKIEGYF